VLRLSTEAGATSAVACTDRADRLQFNVSYSRKSHFKVLEGFLTVRVYSTLICTISVCYKMNSYVVITFHKRETILPMIRDDPSTQIALVCIQ